MNYEELINAIVEEVYKKLQEKAKVDNAVAKKKAVVLWDKNMDKYSEISSVYNVIAYEEGIREYDAVIVSSLCLRGIANLSLGISVSPEERFILKALMLGKKVYVFESGIEYKRYIETAPKELYKKYISFERELRSFGVQIINGVEDLLDVKETKVSREEIKVTEVNVTEESADLRNRKLISEADLRRPEIRGAKRVVIDKKTKITPLAVDYIRINNLKVERV